MRTTAAILCTLSLATGLGAVAARGSQSGVVLEGGYYTTDRFDVGVRLFTDRNYVVAEAPELLVGMTFLRGSINGQTLTCVEPGTLYALSPTPGRAGAVPQESSLLAAGFQKVPLPELQLFGKEAINRVSVYRRSVTAGEQLAIRKWVVLLGSGLSCRKPVSKPWSENAGELLYNGIRLPKQWPPRDLDPQSREPMPVPYLDSPPAVIRIDVGRQLFVDDFLIESTTLTRQFHKARKYPGNPVLKPQTKLELNNGDSPAACPFSDGVFYDPQDKLFKIWYHAGWFDGTACATSTDGIHWKRPELDVVPGTNRVVPPREDFRRDGVSVWLDQKTDRPDERFKMFLYARSSTYPAGGRVLSSPDGIHFTERALTGPLGDNTTFFYNPFRKRWVFSIRSARNMRQRDYWENADFFAARDGRWTPTPPVYWCGADDLDKPDPQIKRPTQLYKVDAVGYESVLLGLMTIHYGPPNDVCTDGKFPKLTEMELAFSRDGFHWDRSWRESFIGASREPGDWERSYIHSAGGCCLIVGDELYFYYGAFSGVSPRGTGGIYAGAATGLATLRRDGFASMDAGEQPGLLTTRPLTFAGSHLFVNLDAPAGRLHVAALDEQGQVIEPFTLENCLPVCGNSTCLPVRWRGADNLAALAGRAVRLRFELQSGQFYSFWVSPDANGASHGYVAAGGPGFTGPTDTTGCCD